MQNSVVLVEKDWRRAEQLSLSIIAVDSSCKISVRATLIDCVLHLKKDQSRLIVIGESEDLDMICKTVQTIKRRHHATKIMTSRMLSVSETHRLLANGIDFIEHPITSPDTFKQVFRKLADGKPTLHQSFVDQLVEELRPNNNFNFLTPREKDVLIQLSHGKTYKQICEALKFTRGSLSVHIQNLYRKLGVSKKCDALEVAFERKFISRLFPVL